MDPLVSEGALPSIEIVGELCVKCASRALAAVSKFAMHMPPVAGAPNDREMSRPASQG